jgi:hypothetical protein
MDHLLPYVILAASLAANLLLFFSLKRELQALRAKHRALSARLLAGEARGELLVENSPAPPRPGFNLNTRVQAMRLSRQGKSPAHIAALLGVPCKEVDLLIRVRQMAAGPPTPVPR